LISAPAYLEDNQNAMRHCLLSHKYLMPPDPGWSYFLGHVG
jgi:hypothetical protein